MFLKSLTQRPDVDFTITLLDFCNLHCSYCYVNKQYKMYNFTLLQKIVNAISVRQEPCVVSLLGGEPTLYPYFLEVITKLSNCKCVKKITVYTNCTIRVVDNKILKNPKVYFYCTFHAESNKMKKFLNNINFYYDSMCNKPTVTVMCTKKSYKLNKIFLNKINPCINVEASATSYADGTDDFTGFDEFKEHVGFNNDDEFLYNGKPSNHCEIFKNHENRWKNAKCYVNDYVFDIGMRSCRQECTGKIYNLSEIKFLSKNDFVICKNTICPRPCWFSYEKEY